MFKEICIIICIIIVVILADFGVQRYLDNSSNELISILENIYLIIDDRDYINQDNLKKEIAKLENSWLNIQDKWTILTVHSELDMIDLALTDFKTSIVSNNINDAYLKVKELEFLFSHIAERDSFKIKNIF